MIKAIREAFDDFVIAARIKPVITAGIPLLLMVFFNGVVKCKWMEAGIGLALSLVVISFAAYIVRELGKTYEEKFHKALGGMPTTIILRFSDDTIDDITKVKYHKWLNEKIPDLQLPESEEEENLDSKSDSKYESVTKHLRIYANSHREQFPRVYQELKKYNYWRNLYGCKWYALSIYAILAIREILMVDKFGIADIFRNPVPKYTMLLVLVVWSILFCSIVSQKTVKRNAFDYAKTLLETVDVMSGDLEA